MTKFAQNFTRLNTGRTFTLKELQSLIGLLNYVCLVVVPGRTFLRRIIILTCRLSNPSHFIRFNCARESRADLQMWSLFIEHYNGRSLISEFFSSSDKELLFTDASSSIGFAGVLFTEWFALDWDSMPEFGHLQTANCTQLCLALELWGPRLADRRILFMSDNEAVVHVVNKQSCKEKTLMELVRRLVLASLSYNILL